MIEKTIIKVELIKNIKENRAKLEKLLTKVPKEDMLKTVNNNWSVKDILSHVISWEQNMIRWIKITLEGGSPEDFPVGREAVDSLNELQYQREKESNINDVLKRFSSSYVEALSIAEALDEKTLNDPDLFEWRKGDAIWFIVAANTYWHYEEHFDIFDQWEIK